MLAAIALAATLAQTRDAYLAHIGPISHLTGSDVAYDYVVRLNEDIDALSAPSPYLTRIASLDNDVVAQYVANAPHPLAQIRGFGTTLVRASSDNTIQPVAVYVPGSYDPKRPAPLVIFLHGREQTETQLLAKPDFARLAESTGSIVVAPYGRGYYDFHADATTDIYDALAAAKGAFDIDPHRQYLAGYSMGGFSIFEVGVVHPADWAALMCVSGGLLSDQDANAVLREMHPVPLYVVTGKNDADIPTTYTTQSAGFLRFNGMAVSYYQQVDGTHRLETLSPILEAAWSDMHRGVVRDPPATFAMSAAPPKPPSGFKP